MARTNMLGSDLNNMLNRWTRFADSIDSARMSGRPDFEISLKVGTAEGHTWISERAVELSGSVAALIYEQVRDLEDRLLDQHMDETFTALAPPMNAGV